MVWPSSVSLYFVARLARERVTVVLTGEGSDETLAGYSRYAFTLKNQAFDQVYRRVTPGFLRKSVRELIAKSPDWVRLFAANSDTRSLGAMRRHGRLSTSIISFQHSVS